MRHKNAITIDIFSGILLVVYCVDLPYQWSCTSCCVGQFEPLLEGSFRRVLLMGHSRDVYQVNRCESSNLSSSSKLFLLSFNKFVSSNNCKSTSYLWRQPVRRKSHTRAIRAQCACVLPTVPLMRVSFPSVVYLNGVSVCVFVVCFFNLLICAVQATRQLQSKQEFLH